MERFDEALQLAMEARQVLEGALPEDHWQIAAAKNAEGAALVGKGNFAQAETLLLASLGGLEQAPIPDLADEGRRRLENLYIAWDRPDEARKYRSKR